jgi:hypothetical protein
MPRMFSISAVYRVLHSDERAAEMACKLEHTKPAEMGVGNNDTLCGAPTGGSES